MDIQNEIAQLRRELDGAKAAIRMLLLRSQVNDELIKALCVTHHNLPAALQAFNAVADAGEGSLLYSNVSDAELAILESLRSNARDVLQLPEH